MNISIIALTVLLLGSACAPGSAPATASQPDAQAGAPKVLTLAIARELDVWNLDLSRGTRGGGIDLLSTIAHNYLVAEDGFSWVPELAVEQLSVEKGTWQLNPDNSMVTTWRIHQNGRWHDGAPFTSDDLMFTFDVMKDPEIPNSSATAVRIMESASAPDPYTFVINWRAPYVDADQAPWLTPMPRHLLEAAYRSDKAGFPAHRWMSSEFIGLGPYRLSNWEKGSHLELTRFDQYFRGRPPLDTVVVRFIPDENARLAGMLAGSLDLIPSLGSGIDAALEVRRRWEGTGNRVGGSLSGRFFTVETQHRTEIARPDHGLADVRVRRAFYQAIDRQEITDAINQGLAPPADSWFFPGHELRPQLEASIPRFPYDPAAALQQLGQVGWARGSDGIMVHQQTGESFNVQIKADRATQKVASIVADQWRAVGAHVEEFGAAAPGDLEELSTSPGAWMGSQGFSNMYTDRFHSGYIAGPDNRWTGRNRSGYNSPRLDQILEQLVRTIEPSKRLPLHRELLQEQMGNLVVMPLFWEYQPFFVAKGVKGVGHVSERRIFDWDKE
ncbi:MAG: hypothetical protein HW416_1963 [Chloroflexi bacterium]|nr:hypothetical protein [Chloroflexota bacterium]